MSRRNQRIPHFEDKAEGDIVLPHEEQVLRFPYDTQLVSSEGVSFHVWMGDYADTESLVSRCASLARNERDVVRFTFSEGKPVGYWAHQDIRSAKLKEAESE